MSKKDPLQNPGLGEQGAGVFLETYPLMRLAAGIVYPPDYSDTAHNFALVSTEPLLSRHYARTPPESRGRGLQPVLARRRRLRVVRLATMRLDGI